MTNKVSVKSKPIIAFYTPVAFKTKKEILSEPNKIHIKINDMKHFVDLYDDIYTKASSKGLDLKDITLLTPIIQRGLLVFEAKGLNANIDKIYFKFKINESGTLLVDIYFEPTNVIHIDHQSNYKEGDLVNFGCVEIDLVKNISTSTTACTSLGAICKYSYKGERKFIKLQNLDDYSLDTISEFSRDIMDYLHDTVENISRLFNNVNFCLNVSDLLRKTVKQSKHHEPQTYVNTKPTERNVTTNNATSSETNIVINITADMNTTTFIQRISKIKRDIHYTKPQWQVRGHYRRTRSGNIVYIQPQQRKRRTTMVQTESNNTNHSTNYIVNNTNI